MELFPNVDTLDGINMRLADIFKEIQAMSLLQLINLSPTFMASPTYTY